MHVPAWSGFHNTVAFRLRRLRPTPAASDLSPPSHSSGHPTPEGYRAGAWDVPVGYTYDLSIFVNEDNGGFYAWTVKQSIDGTRLTPWHTVCRDVNVSRVVIDNEPDPNRQKPHDWENVCRLTSGNMLQARAELLRFDRDKVDADGTNMVADTVTLYLRWVNTKTLHWDTASVLVHVEVYQHPPYSEWRPLK